MGGDKVESKQGDFEEKGLDRTSKEAKYSEEEMKQVESEFAWGFKRPFSATEAVNNMHITLVAGSYTASGDKEMQNHFSRSGVLTGAHASSRPSQHGASSTPIAVQVPKAGALGSGSKPSPTDARMVRGETAHALKNMFDQKVISIDHQLEVRTRA